MLEFCPPGIFLRIFLKPAICRLWFCFIGTPLFLLPCQRLFLPPLVLCPGLSIRHISLDPYMLIVRYLEFLGLAMMHQERHNRHLKATEKYNQAHLCLLRLIQILAF